MQDDILNNSGQRDTSSRPELSPWLKKRLLADRLHLSRSRAPGGPIGLRSRGLALKVIRRYSTYQETGSKIPLSKPIAPRIESRPFLPSAWQPMFLLVNNSPGSTSNSDTPKTYTYDQFAQLANPNPEIRANNVPANSPPVQLYTGTSTNPTPASSNQSKPPVTGRRIIRTRVEEVQNKPVTSVVGQSTVSESNSAAPQPVHGKAAAIQKIR